MDVLVWLRSLGLERYEGAFRDNEIDERVLPNLTLEDLKTWASVSLDIAGCSWRPLQRCAAARVATHPPLTWRSHRVSRRSLPKIGPSAGKSR